MFYELMKKRYSCRSFTQKEVEQEKIDLILEVARLAPTAVNYQPQRILVINDKEKLSRLSECTKYGWNAPIVMIVCYDKNTSWKRKFELDVEYVDNLSLLMDLKVFFTTFKKVFKSEGISQEGQATAEPFNGNN